MVILSIGSKYRPYNGGNAKRASTMCENFSKLGHKIIVVTTSNKENFNDDEYRNQTGITILRFPKESSALFQLREIIKTYKIDIIYTHNNRAWLYSCLLSPKRIKLVTEIHALSISTPFKEFIKKTGLYLMRAKTKAIFVLSNNAKKIIINKYKFNESIVHFAPNGVDDKSNKSSLNFGEKSNFIYAYGGTLYDWQGIYILLSKAKEILNISDDVLIKIIGGGPLLEEVRSFVAQQELSERIIITGFVSEDRYEKELLSTDVLLIPRPSLISTESAIPLKIFDAIKANKPIIMSNVTGLTEVLHQTEALIYQHTNTEGLVECCKKIYRNKNLATKLTSAALEKLKSWPSNLEVAKEQLEHLEKL